MKHKNIFLTCLIWLFCQGLNAQKPEKIISFAKKPNTYQYFKQQEELWQKEVSKNKKNADAWYNFYFAKRYAFIHFPHGKKNHEAQKKSMDSILAQMEKNIPNTFEFNYIKYRENGLNLAYLPYLEKAHKLAPERVEAYTDLVVCYEAMRDLPQRDKFLKMMYEKGDVSAGLMNYNYNVMSGLEPNTILITEGDNDTYPVWLLQTIKGYRKDILLLNKSMMHIDSYRNKVFTELGVDTSDFDKNIVHGSQEQFDIELFKRLYYNSKKYPLALALTTCSNYPETINNNLYITGLTMKYSTERIDNIAFLKKNFEQNYALDYLRTDFVKNDPYNEIVKLINGNYIVPVIKLYEHYKLSGETTKANEYKQLAKTLGKGTEQEEELNKYFSEN